MDTVLYNVLSYVEFEDLVMEKYPFIEMYEFVQSEESSNDVCHSYYFEENEWDKWDTEEWEEEVLKNKDYEFKSYLFFRRLIKDGHLSPGYYLIKVSW